MRALLLLLAALALAPLAAAQTGGAPEPEPTEAEAPAPRATEPEAPALDAAHAAAEAAFEAGVAAWNRGEWERARGQWLAALRALPREDSAYAGPGLPLRFDRAAVLYDLGNAAWRLGDPLRAVAWYTAALRYDPRDADLWANLELARREAGLEPSDTGDFVATLEGLSRAFTEAEARWLALLGLLPLGLALLGEALAGGRTWRVAALLAFLFALACATPLARHAWTADEEPAMVVEEGGVTLLGEPLEGAPRVAAAAAGDVVLVLDELPGWTRVEADNGLAGWVSADSLFALRR